MSTDTGEILQELFDVFAQQLLAEVKAAQAADIPIPAADKAAIIRFLQVNNMAYQPGVSDDLTKLREQLVAKQKENNGSALAAVRAASADIDDVFGLYPDKLSMQ